MSTSPTLFSPASSLGPAERAAALAELDTEAFDVVVIGGGVTGAGCALDAATRGLRVALIEQRDLASGTSSRSSKLFHGGLRYLEQLNFSLVAEALTERGLMLSRLCPHLARPVSFLYPLQHRGWERPYVGAGVGLYDLMASRGENPLPRHEHLTRSGARRLAPALRRDSLVGAIRYWDAKVDDARHTVAVARTAADHGATIVTSVQAVSLIKRGGRVCGVDAVCAETGTELSIDAKQVVNATGTWTDEIQAMAGRGTIRVRASKGVHLVVPIDRIHSDTGMILRTPTSVLFVIPWGAHWIIGTTDTEWNLDLAHPAASSTDIEYLLDQVNSVLANPLTHDDIEGVYAGLRPLLEGESDANSELSREHAVAQSVPGLLTIAGGKYTTYRVMAADAIDAVARNLDREVPKSCTAEMPLMGAVGYTALLNRVDSLAASSGLPVATIEHLLGRYGSETNAVLQLIAERPELGATLPGGRNHLLAEIHIAAAVEGALHLDDVLTRRTRLSIETFDRGVEAAEAVADVMGDVLGWDDTQRKTEVQNYRARVEAERESQLQPDDQTADATRVGAPEARSIRSLHHPT